MSATRLSRGLDALRRPNTMAERCQLRNRTLRIARAILVARLGMMLRARGHGKTNCYLAQGSPMASAMEFSDSAIPRRLDQCIAESLPLQGATHALTLVHPARELSIS